MIFGEPESQPNPQGHPQQQQSIQLDAMQMDTVYANFFALAGAPDEVTLYLGTNLQLPGMPRPAIKLSHRVILLPANAKRLLIALQQTVQQHEDRFGPIEIAPPPPPQRPPGGKG